MSKPRTFLSPSQQEHNAYAGGGVESTHARAICQAAARELRRFGLPVRVARDYTALNEPADYLSAVRESNAYAPTIHVAVHSNAGGGRGTDTFYASAGGKRLAAYVQKAVAAVSVGKEATAGLHEKHGWAELDGTHAPAVLIEVEFHDWPKGAADIRAHHKRYGVALAEGIIRYYLATRK